MTVIKLIIFKLKFIINLSLTEFNFIDLIYVQHYSRVIYFFKDKIKFNYM